MLIFFFLSSIAYSNPALSSKINITVSFSIIEDLAKQIGSDEVTVLSLIDRESEAHDFEPRAKHIVLLKNTDIFIYNGLNFEPWVERFLDQNNYKNIKLNLGESLKLPPEDQNPHTWQDPELLIKYIMLIKDALIKIKPNSKQIFEKNALNLTNDINLINRSFLLKIKKLTKPLWVITPHNGFYHLANAYGFNYIYLSNSNQAENLSAKKIKELIDQIKPLKNAFLFDEFGTKSPLLTTIQKETQLKTSGYLIGDSLTRTGGIGSTIQNYIKYNHETLLKSFNQ
jgi:ABC-type Zn uptake system ZnuABC Zn-binding protein ZnuA